MLPTMQLLVEDVMYFSQGGIPMSTEGMLHIIATRGVRSYLTVWSTSRRIYMPSEKLLFKDIDPERCRYLILEILTNRSHQVNSRNLLGPCFTVVLYIETWWQMLNVHLSYKPPISCRILFHSGGCPRQFSHLKTFRALVVPSGG